LKSEFLWLNNGVSVAENFVDSLISNYENKANVLLVGKLYCLKAEFLRDKGSYSKAEENYKVSLKYFENFPSEGNYLARIFKGLGSVYKNKGDCKTSHDHLLIALNIVMKFGDKITEAGVLASLSGLYLTENKIDQGIKVLKEKAKIGENTGSLREKFYANYDLCLATIEKGDFKVASDIITENADGAKKFKREYYFKMWRGFLNTKKNLESGISIIKSSKIEALNAKEDKRVHLADYLIAASYNYHGVNSEKSKEIFSSLLNDPIVSKQLKNNVQYLIKYPKGIKSI
jgi:tetratricopeptide (TPR) repeat protein